MAKTSTTKAPIATDEGSKDMTANNTKSVKQLMDEVEGEASEAKQRKEGDGTSEDQAQQGSMQILNDIPIPEGRAVGARQSKYAWDDIEVKQSFFVPGAKASTFNTLVSTRNKKNREKDGNAKAKQYISRTYEHNGVKGVMVWRTQ